MLRPVIVARDDRAERSRHIAPIQAALAALSHYLKNEENVKLQRIGLR